MEVVPVNRFPPLVALLFLMGVVYLALQIGTTISEPQVSLEIPYTQFKTLSADGKVAEVILEDHGVRGTLVDPQVLKEGGRPVQMFETRMPEVGDSQLLPTLEKAGVVIRVREKREGMGAVFLYLLPWILIIGFWIWMLRRM